MTHLPCLDGESALGRKAKEAILRSTIRAGQSVGIIKKGSFKPFIVDTTVREKNIAYPSRYSIVS